MLMSSMKSNSIFKCSLIIILIIPLLSQCISASSCGDWQTNNVFFSSYGYSTDLEINNQNSQVTCFKKNVRLSIYYKGFWPLWVKFKVWNDTGVFSDFRIDHCSLYATNFTGLIIHSIYRIHELGNAWYLFGYCSYLKIPTSYI
jgi:hypothetical protein